MRETASDDRGLAVVLKHVRERFGNLEGQVGISHRRCHRLAFLNEEIDQAESNSRDKSNK